MLNEIIQLEENTLGNDYIIGDVHGSAEFQQVVAKLTPNDRLFIVGDLFDRGGSELDVYGLINNDKRIYAVKGNHEEMLLNGIKSNAEDEDIKDLLANGGGWLSANQQIQKKFLTSTMPRRQITERFVNLFKNSPKIQEAPAIYTYVSELPYIIHVGSGANAFLMCHANMPISDEALDSLLQSPKPLSPKIIEHLVWARSNSYGKDPQFNDFANVRSKDSIPVYCGHNILNTADDAVRKESNHINLDGGAYFCGAFLMVNHTQHIVSVVGGTPGINSRQLNVLKKAAKTITKHINQPHLVQSKINRFLVSAFRQLPNELKQKTSTLKQATDQFEKLIGFLTESKKGTSSEKKYEEIIRVANLLKQYTKNKVNDVGSVEASVYLNKLIALINPILIEKSSVFRFTKSKSNEILQTLLQSGKEIVIQLEQQETSNSSLLTIEYKESVNSIKNQSPNTTPSSSDTQTITTKLRK